MALLTLVQSGLMMFDSGLDGASIVDTIYYDTKKGEISLGLASTCCAKAKKSNKLPGSGPQKLCDDMSHSTSILAHGQALQEVKGKTES